MQSSRLSSSLVRRERVYGQFVGLAEASLPSPLYFLLDESTHQVETVTIGLQVNVAV